MVEREAMAAQNTDNDEILDLYAGLRVADVRDGMDWCMMHNQGSMWSGIRPLYRTRAIGIARTARYLPYGEPVPDMTPDEYSEWVGWYYREVCNYPWMEKVEPGDFGK